MPRPSTAHCTAISPWLADSGPRTFTACSCAPLAQAPHAERVVALLDHQAVVPRQLGQRARRAAPRQVRRGRAQHAVVVGQAPRDQVRRDLVAHAHVQVEPLARHVHQAVEHLQPPSPPSPATASARK
jgi:hypothetical protein